MSMTGESKVVQRIFPKKENCYQYRSTQIKIYQQKYGKNKTVDQ